MWFNSYFVCFVAWGELGPLLQGVGGIPFRDLDVLGGMKYGFRANYGAIWSVGRSMGDIALCVS